MANLRIAGVIIPNDYKWYYDWLGEESTCPNNVRQAIDEANGEQLTVEINSPGGEISAGSEIYTALRAYSNVSIQVTGQACSAASIIAMAGYCEMSPTALMMVHCVSACASGNHNDMEHVAEMLTTADRALCSAYCAKSGMSEQDALEMMEREQWLTPTQALELGLIDGIMFEQSETLALTASLFNLPTQSQLDAARKAMNLSRIQKLRAKKHYLTLTRRNKR